MAKIRSIPIQTGSPFTQLFFTPFIGSNGFVGYLDVISRSTDGQSKVHLKVYRGVNKFGMTEYWTPNQATHRTPLLHEDGSPQRNDKGEPMYNEKVYAAIDKELRYRVKLWITPALTHFFNENPDGKVAQNVATQAPISATQPKPGHIVAEDDDASVSSQGGY